MDDKIIVEFDELVCMCFMMMEVLQIHLIFSNYKEFEDGGNLLLLSHHRCKIC